MLQGPGLAAERYSFSLKDYVMLASLDRGYHLSAWRHVTLSLSLDAAYGRSWWNVVFHSWAPL